jgi:hypothetical protein
MRTLSVTEAMERYAEELEKRLLEQFDTAYKERDTGKMNVGS